MILEVSDDDAGMRLDQFLASRLPETSRARLQQWIKLGRVRVNGAAAKSSARLRRGERVEVSPGRAAPPLRAFPEDIPLDVLYEDDDLVVIHKPAGMAVHAGAGISHGTVVNALLHRFSELSKAGGELRPGIVHRLDRLTSGVLLVAKNDAAHLRLARQFAGRKVRKTYIALVHGVPSPGRSGRSVVCEGATWTRLEMPIRRDRRHRIRMTARGREGRAAQTDFRVLRQWPGFSLLEVRIATGRTHQIRVHLSVIGHPVVGDALYGAPAQPALPRVFLHAREITFSHPSTGQPLTIDASPPPELEEVLVSIGKLVLL